MSLEGAIVLDPVNTPAHAVASLLILGDKKRPEIAWPLVAGAVLPDVPMVVFYVYQKFWQGMADEWIWSRGYYLSSWQGFFDVFNSLPVILIGWLVARAAGSIRFQALLASMVVHVLGDLPLHHDDGHRHFYPLSDWRFASPVSYWDPEHYGLIFAPLEALFVIAGSLFLLRRDQTRSMRWLIGVTLGLYAAYWGYAILFWM